MQHDRDGSRYGFANELTSADQQDDSHEVDELLRMIGIGDDDDQQSSKVFLPPQQGDDQFEDQQRRVDQKDGAHVSSSETQLGDSPAIPNGGDIQIYDESSDDVVESRMDPNFDYFLQRPRQRAKLQNRYDGLSQDEASESESSAQTQDDDSDEEELSQDYLNDGLSKIQRKNARRKQKPKLIRESSLLEAEVQRNRDDFQSRVSAKIDDLKIGQKKDTLDKLNQIRDEIIKNRIQSAQSFMTTYIKPEDRPKLNFKPLQSFRVSDDFVLKEIQQYENVRTKLNLMWNHLAEHKKFLIHQDLAIKKMDIYFVYDDDTVKRKLKLVQDLIQQQNALTAQLVNAVFDLYSQSIQELVGYQYKISSLVNQNLSKNVKVLAQYIKFPLQIVEELQRFIEMDQIWRRIDKQKRDQLLQFIDMTINTFGLTKII